MTGDASMDTMIARVRSWIDAAERIVALTGAGISTDSGIPDFRGPQGVWTKNPGAEKMATIQHYVADPDIRRRAWQMRIAHPAWRAAPNPGHLALVALERRGKLDTLITQNVDGLHLKAGTAPERLVEIHGTLLDVICLDCRDRMPIDKAIARVEAGEEDPACRACGGILKTATISFGQSLVERDLERARDAALRCDVMLAVGSTLSVYPIAGVVPLAERAGARIVIVNGQPTEMDGIADAVLQGPTTEILPQLVAEGGAPR
jgi:NAD-dependent deacetylase